MLPPAVGTPLPDVGGVSSVPGVGLAVLPPAVGTPLPDVGGVSLLLHDGGVALLFQVGGVALLLGVCLLVPMILVAGAH